jgi:hypothetical protein
MTINALAAAGDVLIAATLCIMLQKSRTGFKRYVFLLPDFFTQPHVSLGLTP